MSLNGNYKDRKQTQNPVTKKWTKIDTKRGRVLGHKKTPWKNIEIIYKASTEVLNEP